MNDLRQVKHLYSRAGFGLGFADFEKSGHASAKKAAKGLLEMRGDTPISIVQGNTDYVTLLTGDTETRKMFMQKQRQQEKELNLTWINKMTSTDAVLQEKMTLFWHNHFSRAAAKTRFMRSN